MNTFNRRTHGGGFLFRTLFVFELLLGSLSAATYYVDPAGSNANAGTSTAAPWKDFTNVNALTLGPGDQVLLKRGGTWNQWLQLRGAGSATDFIQVGAYGTGARPKIQRSGNVADRCITAYDPSYLKISSLEISNAGAGLVVHFDNTYNNQSVYIDDIVAHDFDGIKSDSVPNSAVPEDYLWRGTNGWDGVVGPHHSPDPTKVNYWAPDHVANSAGIDVTGIWDAAHNSATMINDLKITNCEVYNSGCGVALDWNNHTNRDMALANDPLPFGPTNKATNVVMDGLNIHDINTPWVSCTGIFWASCTNGVLKNSRLYKGAYFASGGTTQLSWYLSTNSLIDNVQVRTSVVPDPHTSDLSIMDLGGNNGLEIRNSTFENIAGYGMGFLYWGGYTGNQSNLNLNFHDNTFLNIAFSMTPPNEPMDVFNAGGDTNNHPTGTIHNNQWLGARDVVLAGGSLANAGNWDQANFYANDIIQNVSNGNDLAIGKTVTSSTVYGSGYEASKVTDNNESTRWASVYSSSTQWIMVDLGSMMPINEVRIDWASPSYAAKYEIRLSDGVSSETVYNAWLRSDPGITSDHFTTRLARYVKVEMTAGNTAYANPPAYSIYSIGIFNDQNLAQGKPATASSTSASAFLTADKADDGDDASRWASAVDSGPRTYEVDLGGAYLINEVKTTWGSAYAKAYTLDVSSDHINWTNKATRSGISSQGSTRDVFAGTSARYVRLTMTQGVSPDPVDYSIAEMRVYAARSEAQDVTASASSTFPTLGYDVQDAVDVSDNTRWSSDVTSSPQWFKVDLGGIYQMNEFITKWDTAYAKDYTIQTSTDDVTYATPVVRTGVASAGTTVDKISAVNARYVMINMTQGYIPNPTNYSIKTFQVNYDLARGMACTASSTNASYPLANATDTSDTSRWSSNVASGAQWFQVDLGAAHTVDRVLVKWETAYAKTYSVQVSTDGVNFTTVKTHAGLRSSTTTDDKFTQPLSARYVRISMTQGYVADPVNYSIYNISIYGPHP